MLRRSVCSLGGGQEGRRGFRGMGDQDAGVASGLGVDADDDLPVEVFGEVGDQAVLADGCDDVAWFEQEPGEVGPFDHATAPSGGNGGGNCRDRGLHGVVAGGHVLDVAASG
jgi:hypothetical protein